MSTKPQKPVPRPYQDSKPYWDAAKENRLLLQRCRDCNRFQFFPRGVCSHCLGSALDWAESSGRGVVHTFTIANRAPHPGFADNLPCVIAIIELQEGVRMMSNIVNCKPETVRIDMPVKVVFEAAGPDIVLPMFAPA